MMDLNKLISLTNLVCSPQLEKTKIEISYTIKTNTIVINIDYFLPNQLISEILNLIYQQLNYFWNYLNYQFKTKKTKNEYNPQLIKRYLKLALNHHFLWKNISHLISLQNQKNNIIKSFIYQLNTIKIPQQLIKNNNLSHLKKQILPLKEILSYLGFSSLQIVSEDNNIQTQKIENNYQKQKKEHTQLILENNQKNIDVNEKEKNKKKLEDKLIQEWNNRKIFELGVHTKFSSLDGISSPEEYIVSAQQKDYAALAVTDHYNVQAFPEFNNQEKKIYRDLKIIYGCEMEMLEDERPAYIFNYSSDDILKQNIDELNYCIFDLETTGIFSSYSEIIEIGYIIYKKGKIICEKEWLVRPQQNDISIDKVTNWYNNINIDALKTAPKIEEIITHLQEDWKDCILVAHNANNFDYRFLDKIWKTKLKCDFPYTIIDTLALSWIIFPKQKSYSLIKLVRTQSQNKTDQLHRALADCKLLLHLFKRIIEEIKKKEVTNWKEVQKIVDDNYYLNRGYKVKLLATNQEGLYNIYRLVSLSHTKRLFKYPCILRSDLIKYRKGLLIGASGGQNGEIFNLFSSYYSLEKRQEAITFYDYLEISSLRSICYLWQNKYLSKQNLENIILSIINESEKLNIPFVAYHNVHYCEPQEKILKEIIIANEGINGTRHSLYSEATSKGQQDRFDFLPSQHLLNREEIIQDWIFLDNKALIEKLIFTYPQKIVSRIQKNKIDSPLLDYSNNTQEKEKELVKIYTERANQIFGEQWPEFVKNRITQEWQIIQKQYVFIYWLAYKIVKKAHKDEIIVGSRGSVGSSFIAYLCNITDINPLPYYKFCYNCRYTELYINNQPVYSCYDYQENECCPKCLTKLIMQGHNLPCETFFGLEGQKTPDIDLNFPGDYQKIAHNYIRQLLGEKYVYRIGTINSLSQQTAEIFWKNHLILRKKLNSVEHFNELINTSTTTWQKQYWENILQNQKKIIEQDWYKNWINTQKLKFLEIESEQSKNEEKNNKNQQTLWEINKQIEQQNKNTIIEKLKGIKRTTGQHPGGLLIVPFGVDIHHYTPLNYPADNSKSEWLTTHFEYDFLSKTFLKMDFLGHEEEKVLQKLFQITGKKPSKISFSDKKIMELFTKADTCGIPEFGTNFVRSKLLTILKPNKFSQLVQISGFAHGTEVWTQNQQTIYKNKELPLNKLIACREDIWHFLNSWGMNTNEAYTISEAIRKGKWNQLSDEVKQKIRSKLNNREGEIYFSILSKIKYIFPQPHAIAYTMTAWRTAFYKVYYPKDFYLVLLACHATVYDIWLMTLDSKAINFHLEQLLVGTKKNDIKELISIIRVLEEIKKEKKRKTREETTNVWQKIDVEQILENIYKKINQTAEKTAIEYNLQKNNTWKLTHKEKELLFTIRIIAEMENKELQFQRGVSFNYSEAKDFKIENDIIYFPFTAVNGIGETVANKIIAYRQQKGLINNKENWQNEISKLLNVNHIKQLADLEKHNILITEN